MKSFYVLFLLTFSLFAQKNILLSENTEISILTCAPGHNELYAAFGHSALRVKDPINNFDVVYNYGIFDFDTPNFYLKFCQGKLLYEVKKYDFKYFPYSYFQEKRWIKAQILNFSKEQNQKVFDYLEWNILPENKKYHYDFFYDNCATKIHEVIEKSIGQINFDYSNFPKNLTHRDLIHLYLVKNSWTKFGIDLALGAVIDKEATLKQYMFLPDYIYTGFKNSTLNGIKTIDKTGFILTDNHLKSTKTNFFLSPLFVALLLLTITLYFVFIYKKTAYWFSTISIVYGILGLAIFVLWFLTEHSTTKINMNLLWANPFLLLYPFLTTIKYKKILSYTGLFALISFLTVVITGFQKFDFSVYVLIVPLIFVYLKPLIIHKND